MLDERKAAVLIALIEEYIRRGEAVSSTTVLETSGLSVSAATIRNDLAALEREGFVTQPHTSAGRIPTAAAYRWYVDHAQPDHLRQPIQIRIRDFFATVHLELGRLLKATSDLVSEVTTYPAVVLAPNLSGETVRGVNLVRMGSRSVLVVIVTNHGRVSQEVVTVDTVVDNEAVRAAEVGSGCPPRGLRRRHCSRRRRRGQGNPRWRSRPGLRRRVRGGESRRGAGTSYLCGWDLSDGKYLGRHRLGAQGARSTRT